LAIVKEDDVVDCVDGEAFATVPSVATVYKLHCSDVFGLAT
jgi:hypothetical protein